MKLFEVIKSVFYALSAPPNILVIFLIMAFIIYSYFKQKPQEILKSRFFWAFILGLFLFPLFILISGVLASANKLPFDEHRSIFIKETFFIHFLFALNIVLIVTAILKSKNLKLLYFSLGLLNFWISIICWGFALIISCNNLFI